MTDKLTSLTLQLVYLFTHLTLAKWWTLPWWPYPFRRLSGSVPDTRPAIAARGDHRRHPGAGPAPAAALGHLQLAAAGLAAGRDHRPAAAVPRRTAAGADQPGSARRPRGPLDRRPVQGGHRQRLYPAGSPSRRRAIVLEGKTPLAETIASGIPVRAGDTLTAELLETIFSPKTPLHDGAVVLRGERLVAASCILPVETAGTGETHLGTRHRAATGLSARVPDALAIVVSGETSHISVAREGRSTGDCSAGQLEEWLDRFQGQPMGRVRTAGNNSPAASPAGCGGRVCAPRSGTWWWPSDWRSSSG